MEPRKYTIIADIGERDHLILLAKLVDVGKDAERIFWEKIYDIRPHTRSGTWNARVDHKEKTIEITEKQEQKPRFHFKRRWIEVSIW